MSGNPVYLSVLETNDHIFAFIIVMAYTEAIFRLIFFLLL